MTHPEAMRVHLCDYAKVQTYTGAVVLVAPPHMADAHPRGICVDVCLALEITKLWQAGITTTGCCCGHGSHHAYIGVIAADIPAMKALGYVVAPNPMRPGAEDSFAPKTQLAPAPAVDGLEVVVPKEPTEEMIAAGLTTGNRFGPSAMANIYRVMLAASQVKT